MRYHGIIELAVEKKLKSQLAIEYCRQQAPRWFRFNTLWPIVSNGRQWTVFVRNSFTRHWGGTSITVTTGRPLAPGITGSSLGSSWKLSNRLLVPDWHFRWTEDSYREGASEREWVQGNFRMELSWIGHPGQIGRLLAPPGAHSGIAGVSAGAQPCRPIALK